MRSFYDLNPYTVLLFYILTVSITAFTANPVLTALSVVSSVIYMILSGYMVTLKKVIGGIAFFSVLALINPLFYHNGVTVLFFLNNNPITLEATLYGVFTSAMIIAVTCWFISFGRIMSSDKLLYVFGVFSPKIAHIFSMVLRYVPMFSLHAAKISESQRAIGLYSEENIFRTITSKCRVFSVMMTWSLENGIITADSMAARGYGTGKRTFFADYDFRRDDICLICLMILLAGTVVAVYIAGGLRFIYYPEIIGPGRTFADIAAYICYGILVFVPSAIEVKEVFKWKRLQSKI